MAKEIKNKAKSFKTMKSDELKKEHALLREELRTIHFKSEGGKSKNVKAGQALKKQIARIMTELHRQEAKK